MTNDNQNVEYDEGNGVATRAEEEMEQYLVFQSDAMNVGVCVDYAVETLINQSITPLPMLPSYICGIINLRGEVIPVINVRLRLGKPSGDEKSVIVLSINDTLVGILVDQVDQMVKIPKKNILPMPTSSNQKLMCGMASLQDGSTMLVLDSLALLEL